MKPSEAVREDRLFVSPEKELVNVLSHSWTTQASISFHGMRCVEIGVIHGTSFQEY